MIVLIVAIGVVVGAATAIHHYSAGAPRRHRRSRPLPAPSRRSRSRRAYDRHQIADLAKKDGLTGDYMKASESFKGFDPDKYGAKNPPNLEGFLFPATYDLPHKPNVDDLIARQLDAFKQYMDQVNMKYAKSKNLTPYDVLKIASMIEREVVVDEGPPADRRRHLQPAQGQGMPLQIDATIRFAENNWTKPLTESDLRHQLAVQHATTNTGPAADADRQPGPGLDRGGRESREGQPTSTSWSKPERLAASISSPPPSPPSSAAQARVPTRPALRPAATRRPTVLSRRRSPR